MSLVFKIEPIVIVTWARFQTSSTIESVEYLNISYLALVPSHRKFEMQNLIPLFFDAPTKESFFYILEQPIRKFTKR